jgi:phosphonate transport system substrate-binding protein
MDVTEVLATQVGKTSGSGNTEAEVLEDGTAVDPGLACMASLEEIKGYKVAFGSATSTSASVYPRLQLLDLGFDIDADIEYSYLGSHDDAVLAVYTGDFDIGASFDDARRNVRTEHPDVGSKVIVFNITDEIPNDVLAVRSSLSNEFKQSLYDAIEAYLATDEGTTAFDEVYEWSAITTAEDSEFDIVRDAVDKLGLTE